LFNLAVVDYWNLHGHKFRYTGCGVTLELFAMCKETTGATMTWQTVNKWQGQSVLRNVYCPSSGSIETWTTRQVIYIPVY